MPPCLHQTITVSLLYFSENAIHFVFLEHDENLNRYFISFMFKELNEANILGSKAIMHFTGARNPMDPIILVQYNLQFQAINLPNTLSYSLASNETLSVFLPIFLLVS